MKRRYKLRKGTKAVIIILCLSVIAFVFYRIPAINRSINGVLNVPTKNVKIALEAKTPSWIEEDFIHIHSSSRTGRQLSDIKSIVIHYVGNPNSTAKNNRDYFDKESTTVSSHFVVGLEGEIIQCLPLYERSAASNHRNSDTISIEVCHPDESGKYNDATYASVVKLSAWLCNKFSLNESGIIRHYDVTGKLCPKYYVENEDAWLALKRDIIAAKDDE